MPKTPPPFAAFEWLIAWRYLRARRAEGGVSVMTWISLIGITLAVFALIATLAVRSGFRSEFVGTILGANAHVTVYSTGEVDPLGNVNRTIADYPAMSRYVNELYNEPGVAGTVNFEHIKTHYYASHKTINPSGVVPKGPMLEFGDAFDLAS